MRKTVLFVLIVLMAGLAISQEIYFDNAQPADIILGAYSAKAKPDEFNHPGDVCYDGKKLFVADTRNNRILIWNKLPQKSGTKPDVVLGQRSLRSNSSGMSARELNWPASVYSDGKRLFVADTYNDRVLIWKRIPGKNGAKPDLVLGQNSLNGNFNQQVNASKVKWPLAVFYDGQRVYVANTGLQRISIWNSFPEYNNQPADLVLGMKDFFNTERAGDRGDFASPISICKKDDALLVSDYTKKRILIWLTEPTKNGQEADVVISDADLDGEYFIDEDFKLFSGGNWAITSTNDGFILAGNYLYIWEELPTGDAWNFSRVAGAGEYSVADAPYGVSWNDGVLNIADTFGNRVLTYDQVPTEQTTRADTIHGARKFTTNIFNSNASIRNPVGVLSTGRQLYVARFDDRAQIYKNLPTGNNAKADYIIGMQKWDEVDYVHRRYDPVVSPAGAWSDGNCLYIADASTGALYYYNQIPTADNQLPDKYLITENDAEKKLEIDGLNHVLVYQNKLIAASTNSRKVFIWNSIPNGAKFRKPDVTISTVNRPKGIAYQGDKFYVAEINGIVVWNELPDSDDQASDFVIYGDPSSLKDPSGVIIAEDHLFAGDANNHRVVIYNSIPENDSTAYENVLGQPNLISDFPGRSKKQMLRPSYLSFDGQYLWVGENTFADRVLRFTARKQAAPPSSPTNLIANAVSANQINLQWSDNAGNERYYLLTYSGGDEEILHSVSLRANTNSYALTGLKANTQYNLSLNAHNSFGAGAAISASAKTLNTANRRPGKIRLLHPSSARQEDLFASSESFTFYWSCVDPDPGDQLVYDVYFGNGKNPPMIREGQRQAIFSEPRAVLPQGDYYIQIVARDLNGGKRKSKKYKIDVRGFVKVAIPLTVLESSGGKTSFIPGTYLFSPKKNRIQRYTSFIVATPNEGFGFSNWEGDLPEEMIKDNPLRMPFDVGRTIKAIFIEK